MAVEFHASLFSADPANAFINPNDIESANINVAAEDKTLRDDSLYQRQVEGVRLGMAARNNLVKTSDHGRQFQNTLPRNSQPNPLRFEQTTQPPFTTTEGFGTTNNTTNILYIAAVLCLLYYLLTSR